MPVGQPLPSKAPEIVGDKLIVTTEITTEYDKQDLLREKELAENEITYLQQQINGLELRLQGINDKLSLFD